MERQSYEPLSQGGYQDAVQTVRRFGQRRNLSSRLEKQLQHAQELVRWWEEHILTSSSKGQGHSSWAERGLQLGEILPGVPRSLIERFATVAHLEEEACPPKGRTVILVKLVHGSPGLSPFLVRDYQLLRDFLALQNETYDLFHTFSLSIPSQYAIFASETYKGSGRSINNPSLQEINRLPQVHNSLRTAFPERILEVCQSALQKDPFGITNFEGTIRFLATHSHLATLCVPLAPLERSWTPEYEAQFHARLDALRSREHVGDKEIAAVQEALREEERTESTPLHTFVSNQLMDFTPLHGVAVAGYGGRHIAKGNLIGGTSTVPLESFLEDCRMVVLEPHHYSSVMRSVSGQHGMCFSLGASIQEIRNSYQLSL